MKDELGCGVKCPRGQDTVPTVSCPRRQDKPGVKKCSVHPDVMHERRLTPPHVRRHFLPRPVSQKFRSGMQEKFFHDFYPFWIISVSQEGV